MRSRWMKRKHKPYDPMLAKYKLHGYVRVHVWIPGHAKERFLRLAKRIREYDRMEDDGAFD